MKRRFDPITSQIINDIESNSVYRMHINRVSKTKATIDDKRPPLSLKHKLIYEKQEKKRRQMMEQKTKTKRYTSERDIPTSLGLTCSTKNELMLSTVKSADARRKIKDISQTPVFSTVAPTIELDSDSLDTEESSLENDLDLFILPKNQTSTMSTRSLASMQTTRMQSRMPTRAVSAKTSPIKGKKAEIDYSIVPGMRIVDDILRVELSSESSSEEQEEEDIHMI